MAMTDKSLAEREAALELRERNLAVLENGERKGTATLDHGIQEGRLRCRDQMCDGHWNLKPVKVHVEEFVRFIDQGELGRHDFTNRVLNSHFYYHPQESTVCGCGQESLLIPPGGESAFDSVLDERIAEAGPGIKDQGMGRIQRMRQLSEHENTIAEMRKATAALLDSAKKGT